MPVATRSYDLVPISGVVGVAMFVVGSLIPGTAPKPDASGAEVVAYLLDQRMSILVGTAIVLLSVPFFGVFVGAVRAVLSEVEGPRPILAATTVFGWTLLIAIVSVGFLSLTAITWRGADHLDVGIVQFGYDTSVLALYALSAPAAALTVAAPSILLLRTGLLPRWIAWLGLAEVAVNLVEVAGITARAGVDAGGYAAGIGPLVWSVWVVAFAIGLARRSRTT